MDQVRSELALANAQELINVRSKYFLSGYFHSQVIYPVCSLFSRPIHDQFRNTNASLPCLFLSSTENQREMLRQMRDQA
jgi:hypothetical protein